MESRVDVPTVTVPLAEVEQGRIAVEALTAVEVQPAIEEQLSGLDIDELPRQLVLRTTNPILLAYKYVHADTPHRLELEVTRHRVVGIQEAAIDRAEYRTLFTTDGLLVTTARFNVRNTRKQFLRVRLPENSEVWSAFVNGAPETPALSIDDDGEGSVLIKIINSVRAFPVELIYATRGSAVGGLGWVDGALPRPDILVTESRWDVYLPDDMRYGEPSTNMDLASSGARVSAAEMDGEFAGVEKAASATQAIKPLRIVVPTSGIHFALEKLYANQSDQDTWFRVSYASEGGVFAGRMANLAGVALLWGGIFVFLRRKQGSSALPGLMLAPCRTRDLHRDDRCVPPQPGTGGGGLGGGGDRARSPADPALPRRTRDRCRLLRMTARIEHPSAHRQDFGKLRW